MDGYKQQMEGCILKCADDHINLVDNMLVRMRETLKDAQEKQQQMQHPAPKPTGVVLPGMDSGVPGAAPTFPRRMPAGMNPLGMPMGPRPGGAMHD